MPMTGSGGARSALVVAVSLVGPVSFATLAACGDDTGSADQLDCEVAIIGGGAGGLHTAFRLAPTLGDRVCLFEKETRLGGRIKDVQKDDANPNGPRFGTGAMRVMEGQQVLFDLGTELGITFEAPATESDLIRARGRWGTGKESLLPAYPTVTPIGTDTETGLYDFLRDPPQRPMAASFPDFRSYIRNVAGDEEFAYLHDMSRFRADFEAPLDAVGYLDYLDEEWDVCCTPSYPVGGMSRYIVGMADRATAAGARIYTGEPVSSIDREGARYRLTTSAHTVLADKVVIAIPPNAFNYIEGDIAEAIQAEAEYKAIIAIPVITISQWWPNRWWETLADPADMDPPPANNLWRAWSTEHCFNLIEMPLQAYAVDQAVTRSVYDDDLNCVQFWQNVAAGGTVAVEAEIKRGLELMFNNTGVSTPATVTIPAPLKTYVQYWPDAWHWLRAGSNGITNAELFGWAVEPLAGENISMVGEAYNVQRSGWSDAAYKSSINVLNAKYGLSLPGLGRTVPVRPDRQFVPWSMRRN